MSVVCLALSLFQAAALAQIVISWLRYFKVGESLRGVYDMLDRVTGPVVRPVRRVLPPIGMFDLSFLVVLFSVGLIARALKCAPLI